MEGEVDSPTYLANSRRKLHLGLLGEMCKHVLGKDWKIVACRAGEKEWIQKVK